MKHVPLGLNGAPQTAEEERPSLAEKYSRAVQSSHLKMEEGRCDVDYLIAASWCGSKMATTLLRLRREFDAARSSIRQADGRAGEWQLIVDELERLAKPLLTAPYVSPAQLLDLRTQLAEIDRMKREMRDYLTTERALVLITLKTLQKAKTELTAVAIVLATKRLFMQNDEAVARIAARALDAWLDPVCPACEGRGFNGGRHRGEQKVTCGGCRGFGERRAMLGDTVEEKRFARDLLDAMAGLLRYAEDQMKFRLSEHLTD